jgi:hypothetical protein
MNAQNHKELVVEMAFDIVQEMAPDEQQLFRVYSKSYLRKQNILFKDNSQKDELLGFGVGESITILTPFILTVISEVVKFIAEDVRTSLRDKKSADINATVKGTFKKHQHDKVKPNPLTPDQILAIRKMIIAKGGQMKIPEDRVRILADLVVGGLVTKLS